MQYNFEANCDKLKNRIKLGTLHTIKTVRFKCLKINYMNDKRNKMMVEGQTYKAMFKPSSMWNQNRKCHYHGFI